MLAVGKQRGAVKPRAVLLLLPLLPEHIQLPLSASGGCLAQASPWGGRSPCPWLPLGDGASEVQLICDLGSGHKVLSVGSVEQGGSVGVRCSQGRRGKAGKPPVCC